MMGKLVSMTSSPTSKVHFSKISCLTPPHAYCVYCLCLFHAVALIDDWWQHVQKHISVCRWYSKHFHCLWRSVCVKLWWSMLCFSTEDHLCSFVKYDLCLIPFSKHHYVSHFLLIGCPSSGFHNRNWGLVWNTTSPSLFRDSQNKLQAFPLKAKQNKTDTVVYKLHQTCLIVNQICTY